MMPAMTRGKRVFTSVEAVTRFLFMLDYLEADIVESGGVDAWIGRYDTPAAWQRVNIGG